MATGEGWDAADHVAHLRKYGFTVVPGVLPTSELAGLREEVMQAQAQADSDWRQMGVQGDGPVAWEDIWPQWSGTDGPVGPLAKNLRNFRGFREQSASFPQSSLANLPRFRQYLSHPMMLAIAREMLSDDHVRLMHLAISKSIPPSDHGDSGDRGFHSDWPHDMASLVSVPYDVSALRPPAFVSLPVAALQRTRPTAAQNRNVALAVGIPAG